MFKRLFFRNNSKKGFTLIELLVVIAIIGILASIILASLNTARKKSRDARRIADVKQLQNALTLCFDSDTACGTNDGQEYPDTLAELTSGTTSFIPAVPNDPLGVAYQYDNLLDDTGAACDIATDNCEYYALGATIEEASNSALNNDLDTTLGAVDGTDPVYMVTP